MLINIGTLCAIGMAVLRLPYTPAIGVSVGVTAFIPYKTLKGGKQANE